MDHQISDNISITINLTKIPQKVDFFKANPPKTWAVALFKIGVAIKWIWYRLYSKNFYKKDSVLKIFWSYWYIKWWMMAMDSIKFRSVHLMDDGDGHHNFGIDGDGDGHHFKGDGRHVWPWHTQSKMEHLLPKFYNFAIKKPLQLNKQKYSFLKNEPLI